MTDHAKQLAEQLLDAEVKFWLSQLSGKKLETLLEQELEYVHDQLAHITLDQAVDKAKVKVTARKYAVEMEIGGGIPELFGEIADVIFKFKASEKTKIGEIVSDDIAQEFIEKIFETGGLIDHGVTNVRNSKAFKHFMSDVVMTVMKGYLFEQASNSKFGSIASGTKRVRDWLSSKAPELSEGLEDTVRALMDSGISSSLEMVDEALDHEVYRETAQNSALDLWEIAKDLPISSYKKYISADDLQEFMVMGYEFWLEFRNTPYLKHCIDTGVDFFFKKYGKTDLQTLLEEIGVTREMVLDDLQTYIPDLAKLLIDNGMAETMIRRQLSRFYHSKKALDILSKA